MDGPPLTAFAAPRGGAGLPWGGPAAGLMDDDPRSLRSWPPEGG